MFTEKTIDDRVTVAEGTFESVDVEDGWADLVVIAQVSPSNHPPEKRGLSVGGRPFIGAQTTRRQPRNFPESSNPEARSHASGTWRTGAWDNSPVKVAQKVDCPLDQATPRLGLQRLGMLSNLTKQGLLNSA